MGAELKYPWPVQAAQLERVWIMHEGNNALKLADLARKWAKAHHRRVETRVFYGVLLLRWSRNERVAS